MQFDGEGPPLRRAPGARRAHRGAPARPGLRLGPHHRAEGRGGDRLTAERLLPEPDEQSAPFWAAAADHVLTLARCGRCDAMTLPPDVVCPHCGSTEPGFEFVPVSGQRHGAVVDGGAPGVLARLRGRPAVRPRRRGADRAARGPADRPAPRRGRRAAAAGCRRRGGVRGSRRRASPSLPSSWCRERPVRRQRPGRHRRLRPDAHRAALGAHAGRARRRVRPSCHRRRRPPGGGRRRVRRFVPAPDRRQPPHRGRREHRVADLAGPAPGGQPSLRRRLHRHRADPRVGGPRRQRRRQRRRRRRACSSGRCTTHPEAATTATP